ncbi:MAG TPA: hypothetical protein VNU69_04425 [Rhizomicrobium sp.]|nr:hypothetical protein [Rhizomicrobium sp.]
MNHRIAFALIGILVSAGTLPSKAETDFSKCALPKNVRATKALADIPAPILAQTPGLGAADGPLITDAHMLNETRPTTRLAGAFSRQYLWAVAYEKGGIGTQQLVAVFTLPTGGTKATLIGQHKALLEGGYCAVLERTFYESVRP